MKNTRLPSQLEAARVQIEQIARDYGLDFFPVIYEVLDYRTLYETAAFGGFPTRYPHWRFGMEFDQLIKGHVWAGSTIYEMVVNTNPSYAYLLEGNEDVTQKMVMAHVTGHVDFFKHNMWFAHTNRKMLDAMANHATRIQRVVERIGYDLVEDFIDTCLSLENLIDYHSPYIRRAESQTHQPVVEEAVPDGVEEGLRVDREYMREFINPPAILEEERLKQAAEREKQRRFPESSQKDILLFLMNYAPLERWQHTVLEIVRDEAYYFAPQGMTKVLNEGWACCQFETKLFTSAGVLKIGELVEGRKSLQVSDGSVLRQVYDWAKFENYETVKIRTRRGLEIEGSVNHRVMLPDGSWRRLDEFKLGERVTIQGGRDLWAKGYFKLKWLPTRRPLWDETSEQVSELNVDAPQLSRPILLLGKLAPTHPASPVSLKTNLKRLQPLRVPKLVDEDLGAFLGYLTGDGHISEVKRTIGLTTGDEEQADRFVQLVWKLFRLQTRKRWDPNRWRISFSSADITDFLKHLGMKTGVAARVKDVPAVILQSPKSVVASFLRALYDCDGYAGTAGVILATSSLEMSKTIQLLLLNFGVLSTRRPHKDGCWHVHTTGLSTVDFQKQIGFGLERKQTALRNYIENRRWFKAEDWSDEIVEIERGRADVYDISVEETHRYAAQGFINHNSYWHSTIMTQNVATASEIITFADLHSGVVATGGGRLNPYKLGLELLRDVEDRWNKGRFGKEYDECDDLGAKRTWDKQLGLGRQKIFEIRKLYNDVTFIDEFLTPEFVIENKLFSFRYNRDTDLYEIASREFKEIKEKLLFRLTNFGQPSIYVEDGNYNNRGELYLRHRHEGVDLKMDYARDTMRNLHKIWTRPIHLETLIDDKKRLLSFDGSDFTERRID